VTADELGASWRPGCPVGPELLRRVELDYVGFDGLTHRGELIVHRDLVADVIAVFEQLESLGYPIAKMQSVVNYPGAEDELSMEDNNTSAFNCRPLPGSNEPSLHAYGRAIDINPLINPYVDSSGHIEPATGGPYLDRSRTDPGFCTTAIRSFAPSSIAVGAGAATGERRRTISTSRCASAHIECSAGSPSGTMNDAPAWTGRDQFPGYSYCGSWNRLMIGMRSMIWSRRRGFGCTAGTCGCAGGTYAGGGGTYAGAGGTYSGTGAAAAGGS
jgi:hypothetical protein